MKASSQTVTIAVAMWLIATSAGARDDALILESHARCRSSSVSCGNTKSSHRGETGAIAKLLRIGDALCKETLSKDWKNPEKSYFELAEKYQGYDRTAGPYTGEFESSTAFVDYASNPMVVATGCKVLGVKSENNHLDKKFPTAILSYCWTGVIGNYDRNTKILHRLNTTGRICADKEFSYDAPTRTWTLSGAALLDGATTPRRLRQLQD